MMNSWRKRCRTRFRLMLSLVRYLKFMKPCWKKASLRYVWFDLSSLQKHNFISQHDNPPNKTAYPTKYNTSNPIKTDRITNKPQTELTQLTNAKSKFPLRVADLADFAGPLTIRFDAGNKVRELMQGQVRPGQALLLLEAGGNKFYRLGLWPSRTSEQSHPKVFTGPSLIIFIFSRPRIPPS